MPSKQYYQLLIQVAACKLIHLAFVSFQSNISSSYREGTKNSEVLFRSFTRYLKNPS